MKYIVNTNLSNGDVAELRTNAIVRAIKSFDFDVKNGGECMLLDGKTGEVLVHAIPNNDNWYIASFEMGLMLRGCLINEEEEAEDECSCETCCHSGLETLHDVCCCNVCDGISCYEGL